MKLSYSRLPLTLRDTFRISREASDTRENVLVKVVDETGTEGIGESAPSRFYDQTAATVIEDIAGVELDQFAEPFGLELILASLSNRFGIRRSGLAAIDMALHDLVAKRLGIPLVQWFGLDRYACPPTSFTIGLASLDEIRRKTEAASDYKVLKVKLGGEQDREIVAAIREFSSVPLRVDANAAWSLHEALEQVKWLRDEGVELVEQPLAPKDYDGMRRLTEASPLPIIADESSETAEDVVRLRGCVHGINIKLNKCGGLREALKMVHIARAQGMQVMLGCFIESSVGISAAASLSPLVDYVDLDGHLLIRDDPFEGLTLDDGRVIPSARPGLGLAMNNPGLGLAH